MSCLPQAMNAPYEWLLRRFVPKNRQFVPNVPKKKGLSPNFLGDIFIQ